MLDDNQALFDENGDKKKFVGAIVQQSKKMTPTGTKIDGVDAKFVHKNVIDEDIESEYPTAMCISNLSNDTFVGKVIMDNDGDIDLPVYNIYEFIGDDSSTYRINKAATIMETISQRDFILAGKLAFNLPTATKALEILKIKGII